MKKFLIAILAVLLLGGCSIGKEDNKKVDSPNTKNHTTATKEDMVDVSFTAVGDNLIHGAIYYYNNKATGTYNFNDLYQNTNYLTQDADIAYINQETICGGVALGLSTYPSFNGPYEVLDGVASAGFDWMAASSNHSMDAGEQGIVNQLTYMNQHYPEIKVTGSHATAEDAKRMQVIKRKGVSFGILGYTYGLNGYALPEGKDYLIDQIDKDKIKRDVAALIKVSDVQLVSMHWGTEYSFEPNEEQIALAQFLSDLGVDVIIGEHPHVIQPMDFVSGKKGNKTLVIYSLGNFLSAQDVNDRMLGGMARWKIAYNKITKDIEFKDVEFWPTITQIEGNYEFYRTNVLKDYTDELAARHTLTIMESQDMTREYFIQKVQSIMNDKVKIVY